ncbi:MAG: hypothetical protein GY714_10780 [Desulfobacterales bacterium]|nr:hypothetical protein [Desulfobacterales bacterium]
MYKNNFRTILFSVCLIFLTGCASIHDAAEKGDVQAFNSELLKGVGINKKNLTGFTPLHIASKSGQLNMVQLIIKKRGIIDAKNSFLQTPLHLATKNGHLSVVKILIDNGANIRSRDNHGNTPLLVAAENGHLSVVKFLVKNGADIKHINAFRETASYFANKSGHTDVVDFLHNSQIVSKSINRKSGLKKDRTPPLIEIYSPSIRGLKLRGRVGQTYIAGKVSDDSKIKVLRINGNRVSLNTNGHFKVGVDLKKGLNKFKLVASDIYNNSSIRNISIDGSKKPKVNNGSYHALIIGNNNYEHLPDLKTAVNDARVIDQILRKTYGFQTHLLINGSKRSISRAINAYRKKLTADDHFLIYYAGHGHFDKQVNKAYWWPVDAETDDDTNWIIADTITTNIKRIASKHILIIADSCYSGTLTRSASAKMKTGMKNSEYINKMLRRNSRTLIASGGNEPVADGGGEGHSIFAASLIKELKNKKESLFTAENLFYENIKESVAGKSSQVPQYSIIRNSGHEGGDFVFRKKVK